MTSASADKNVEPNHVVKNDGSIEYLDVDKVHAAVKWATQGLDVDQSEVEVRSQIEFYDGISTKEIQEALIIAAAELVSPEKPDYTYVAARLLLQKLYKTVVGGIQYPHLQDTITWGIDNGKFDASLYNLDLERLNQAITPSRDFQFSYLGLQTLTDRYLAKEPRKQPDQQDLATAELPQHFWMRVAMGLALNEDVGYRTDWAIEFYHCLSRMEVVSSTPTLFNAGTKSPQMSSCYLNTVDDSLEGIYETITECAKLSKFAGGIGTDWTRVRGKGDTIGGTNGKSSGVVPFLKVFNDTALASNQSGLRPGAFAAYLEPWHPDVYDFIDLKEQAGEERRRAHDIFPALWIPDLFMKRVENGEMWSLISPNDCPELHELYGEEFERTYQEAEESGLARSQVNAFELWQYIIKSLVETGAPWITFKDEPNRRNMQKHQGVIHNSNLCCVSGDQRVPTARGMKTVKQLYDEGGENRVVGLDGVYPASPMALPRPNALMVEIRTMEGYTHKVTPDHPVWLKDQGWVEAAHLGPGDLILIQQVEGLWGYWNDPDGAVSWGWYSDKEQVPDAIWEGDRETVSHYLLGLYQANSCLEQVGSNYVAKIDSPSSEFLQDIQRIWANFGVKSYIDVWDTDRRYELSVFTQKHVQDITGITLYDHGFKVSSDADHDTRRLHATVAEVVECSNEDAYCLKVDSETRAWTCNGVITKNTEITLNTSDDETAVCNLASINLSRVNTRKHLERVIPTAIRMLDNVIDLNLYPSEKAKVSNLRHRPVGLGVMGYAEYLAQEEIDWDTERHLEEADRLFEALSFYAINASSDLAVERGAYPTYKGSDWSKGILPIDTAREGLRDYSVFGREGWDGLRRKVRWYGMRNCQVMAIAPTATIANICGTTPCIEPVFQKFYVKENLSGSFRVVDPTMQYTGYTKTAFEIDQEWIIRAAAKRQKWVDQSQSLNLFKLQGTLGRVISNWYFLAWKSGLKTTYYLRNEQDSNRQETTIDPIINEVCTIDNGPDCESCE